MIGSPCSPKPLRSNPARTARVFSRQRRAASGECGDAGAPSLTGGVSSSSAKRAPGNPAVPGKGSTRWYVILPPRFIPTATHRVTATATPLPPARSAPHDPARDPARGAVSAPVVRGILCRPAAVSLVLAATALCLADSSTAADDLATPPPTNTTPPATKGIASTPASAPVLAPALCLERLDAAVRLAGGGDEAAARGRLERLAGRCEHLPQIRHDLGVLAARAGESEAAIAALEAALEADPRSAETLAHLRALHRREAAIGYARALGKAKRSAPPLPELALQDSTDVNADTLRGRADRSGLRDSSTLEYELYAWWHGADDGDEAAWLAYYADDYPPRLAMAGRTRPARANWADVRREIAFTAEDAVAVLEHGRGGPDAWRRLLLLRLEGDRWKIYRERPL